MRTEPINHEALLAMSNMPLTDVALAISQELERHNQSRGVTQHQARCRVNPSMWVITDGKMRIVLEHGEIYQITVDIPGWGKTVAFAECHVGIIIHAAAFIAHHKS